MVGNDLIAIIIRRDSGEGMYLRREWRG